MQRRRRYQMSRETLILLFVLINTQDCGLFACTVYCGGRGGVAARSCRGQYLCIIKALFCLSFWLKALDLADSIAPIDSACDLKPLRHADEPSLGRWEVAKDKNRGHRWAPTPRFPAERHRRPPEREPNHETGRDSASPFLSLFFFFSLEIYSPRQVVSGGDKIRGVTCRCLRWRTLGWIPAPWQRHACVAAVQHTRPPFIVKCTLLSHLLAADVMRWNGGRGFVWCVVWVFPGGAQTGLLKAPQPANTRTHLSDISKEPLIGQSIGQCSFSSGCCSTGLEKPFVFCFVF